MNTITDQQIDRVLISDIDEQRFNAFIQELIIRTYKLTGGVSRQYVEDLVFDAVYLFIEKFKKGEINENNVFAAGRYIMICITRKYIKELEQNNYKLPLEKIENHFVIVNEVLDIESKIDEIPPLSNITIEELMHNISNQQVFHGKIEQEKAFKAFVKYYGKKSYEEIALLCNYKPEQFRQNLSRAKRTLKKHIRENISLWGNP